MSAGKLAIWSLCALLAACDQVSLPAPAVAAVHAAAAPPAPVAESGNRPSAEVQGKCDREARDWYERQRDWEDAPNSTGVRVTSTYANHYSAKFNRCYAVVDRSTSNTELTSGEVTRLRTSTLTDVAANRDIGTAHWSGTTEAFNQCQVNGTACLSKEEWLALLRPYLEE